ncbi:MAG: divergent polysaccharide deacetylase family protein [Deltaproteobacteria bacterium]|nr:divergent polysaccharide deacetylase family protein [Deltaproteobacteria bacterium]MCW8893982.1 divergent polysaccharide deacetylase family protein [Deltaproteobacteria bacterium]
MRILLASGFLLFFVALCLMALVALRGKLLPEPVFVYEEPAHEIQTQKVYDYADIYALIENQLLNGPQSMGWRKLSSTSKVQIRKIFGDFPSDLFLAELITHIEQTNSPAQLQVNREQGIIHLFWQEELQLELRYRVPDKTQTQRGKIAIIMDDMGGSLSTLHKLLDMDLPVTPAILPGTDQATSAAALLQSAEREYMIHIPMQPRSYPRTNPGANALLLGQSEGEIRRLVRSYMLAVPGAVGGNNHMGSRYTEEAGLMRIVLDELKQHNQFFIDSRTIGSSVAFSEARKMGLKTATRNIFLDNQEDVTYIREQIRKMVRLAGSDREIIAICHPYKETLQALNLELAWLKTQPVDFVQASSVVHIY